MGLINKLNLFAVNGQTVNVAAHQPVRNAQEIPTSFAGVTSPANRLSFGHLTGVSKNGPGSLLQAKPGETGLGDNAILAQNGELGRRLYLNT